MEIAIIIIVIALLMGKQDNKGIMKYVPHMAKVHKEENVHRYDTLIG